METFLYEKFEKNPIKRLYRRLKKSFCGSNKVHYLNSSAIDTYIDEYFLLQCPDSLSVSDNQLKVHSLFHTIITTGVPEIEISNENQEAYHLLNQLSFFKNK